MVPQVIGDDGEEEPDTDSSAESEEDPTKTEADEHRPLLAKKAGLPEVQLDALPSTQSTKYMKLGFVYAHSKKMGSSEQLIRL